MTQLAAAQISRDERGKFSITDALEILAWD